MMNNKKTGNIKKLSIKKLYGGKLKEVNIPIKKGNKKINILLFNIDVNLLYENVLKLNFLFYSFF
mgnify:CR=1 FL=1